MIFQCPAQQQIAELAIVPSFSAEQPHNFTHSMHHLPSFSSAASDTEVFLLVSFLFFAMVLNLLASFPCRSRCLMYCSRYVSGPPYRGTQRAKRHPPHSRIFSLPVRVGWDRSHLPRKERKKERKNEWMALDHNSALCVRLYCARNNLG